jgi:hypothetical protein
VGVGPAVTLRPSSSQLRGPRFEPTGNDLRSFVRAGVERNSSMRPQRAAGLLPATSARLGEAGDGLFVYGAKGPSENS